MDGDGFSLNLSFDDTAQGRRKLGWKERKVMQAERRKARGKKQQQQSGAAAQGGGALRLGAHRGRGGGAGGSGRGMMGAGAAATKVTPAEGGVPSLAHAQPRRPPAALATAAAGAGGAAAAKRALSLAHGAPPKQPPKQQKHAPKAQANGTGGDDAADANDLADLVALSLRREAALAAELGGGAGGGGGGGGGSDGDDDRNGGGGGVVEFGDAEDEPDWHRVSRGGGGGGGGAGGKTGPPSAAKHKQQRGDGGGGGGSGAGGKKFGGKTAATAAAAAAGPNLKHRTGELVRAGAPVPAAQRGAIFGDAGTGDDAPADWAGLGLSGALAGHLSALNFAAPTRVQRAALLPLLAGRDAIVRAPTGSGKTLAYLAPVVQSLAAREPRVGRADGTYAVVLSPTRELAVQISDVLTALCRRFNWLVPGMLIGGEHRGHEKARLRRGVTALVATPGRLLDHLNNTAAFSTAPLRWLVLDEADRLLDLGNEAKLAQIADALDARARGSGGGDAPPLRQTVLLSATLSPALGVFARRLVRPGAAAVGFAAAELNTAAAAADGSDPGAAADASKGAAAAGPAAAGPAGERFEIPAQLRQAFVEAPTKLRLVALVAALRSRLTAPRRAGPGDSAKGGKESSQQQQQQGGSAKAKVVVFFSSCDSVEFHHALLSRCAAKPSSFDAAGFDNDGGGFGGGTTVAGLLPVAPLKLHGDLPQAERTSNMLAFAKAERGVLLCTDVAARGLDFPAVTAIVQYDAPGEPADYVHRVGRTARLGQHGEALALLAPGERGYADLLAARGVVLREDALAGLLRALPAAGMSGGGMSAAAWSNGKRRGGYGHDENGENGAGDDSVPAAALALQRALVAAVERDAALKALAADAFRSFLRAYAVHPAHLKPFFRVKALHLGHVAASFALSEAPSALGESGAARERRRRKAEAVRDEASRRRKKMRGGAAAAVEGAR